MPETDKDIDGWYWGNNILQDIEAYRNYLNTINQKTAFYVSGITQIQSDIIERELKRKLRQQNSANEILSPTAKQKLEQERDSYKEKFNSVCKWFEYYQDKSKELEDLIQEIN